MGKRAESPKPTQATDPASSEGKQKTKEAVKFVPPPRPDGLRESVLRLYGILAASILVFAIIGHSMVHDVPKGKFEMKDGSIIDILDFDASDLGPYPKCHPHHEEYQVVAEDNTTSWVKNSDAPKGGPFPVGHPENPEWVIKADAMMQAMTKENRLKWKGLQPNLHLLVLATLCVLIGSKHGLLLFTEPVETRQGAGPQVLQSEDAAWFPIMGSGVLLGLFLVLKYLGSYWIKTLITCWIVLICSFGMGKNFDEIVKVVRNASMKPLFRVPYFDEDVRPLEIVGLCIGATMAVFYVISDPKPWLVNNIFGCSFCLLGIRMIGLSTIKVGTILLCGLFFYDIFWVFGSKSVFGSNVMVSVATGVDAPIKLMFPRDLGGCGHLRHSMLGLGDIVLPGLYIAFLAKFDAVRLGEKAQTSFVYLNAVMISYVLSLVTTVTVMLFFNAAQPALLYIVPYVLITTAGVAASRGELKALWQFEIPDESADETKAAEAKAAETKANGEKKDD